MQASWRISAAVLTLTLALQPGVCMAKVVPGLTALASQAREEADVPALGLVVMRADGDPQVAVDGVRLAGGQTRATVDDVWHLGSISKSFTASLVARLVEKGVVSWDDTVGDRLGRAVADMHSAYRDVTFVHLLSHHSGLPANIPMDRFAAFARKPKDPIADRVAWVRLALAMAPIGPKEVTYEYSNNGYIVAGAMLEAATGRSWEDLMKQEVFGPLGLASAGFGPPRGATADAQPRGHQPENGKDMPVAADADNPPALGPAGRIHMSLSDVARYLNAHATRREDFLTKASYEKLHTTPFGGSYALGWVVTQPDGRWHNGSNTMWYAEVAINLAEGHVAAVVVNDGEIARVQPTVRTLLRTLMSNNEQADQGVSTGAD